MNFIKNILRKIYCHNCFDIHFYKTVASNIRNDNQYLKKENSELKLYEKIILKITTFNSSCQSIIYFECHETNFFLITVEYEYNSCGLLTCLNFYGYILDNSSASPNKVMTLFTKIIYDINQTRPEGLYIIDFIGIPNKGYGSKLMYELLKYIKPLHIKYIKGKLSPVDEIDLNNKNRRSHFYKKFGFLINDNNIYLDLN